MKKKVLSLCLVVALVAIAVASATFAYFTDNETAENVFTIGNVDIKLHESTLHRDNNAATDDQIVEDAENYKDYLAEAGKNIVPGKWVKKAPYIENVGSNPAYVRIKMTINKDLFDKLDMMLYTTAFDANAIVMDNGVEDGEGNITYTFTYTEALDPEEVTYYAPFWQFKVKDSLNNADVADVAGFEQKIFVTAEAIQSETFDDYVEAFAAFDAQA